MQTQLPFFPTTTKLINPFVGVNRQEDMIYYLHNGSPLFCHSVHDRNAYRYITANLIQTNLCRPSEIAQVFGVSARSIQQNAKALREKGPGWFFNRVETRGKCYKFTSDRLEEAQKMIDAGYRKSEIAKQFAVSTSSIDYHIRGGKLKKKRTNQK